MNFITTTIPGLWIIEPKVFGDSRGHFFESFKHELFEAHVGPMSFIQENEAFSTYGVLRGLHYQTGQFAQAKLVRVVLGEVLDVVVDIRPNSTTYGQHLAVRLSSDNKKQLFVPRGFAHGYVVLSETAVFQYKVDNKYAPQAEGGIRFDDPQIAINWQLEQKELLISEKDKILPLLSNI
jgi:dTDP-4-dehydrorhamnose 3,5-epimerase